MSNDPDDTEMRYDKCIDSATPRDIPLCAKYKRSFAYFTVKERLPVILTQIVDYLSRNKEKIANELGKDSLEEVKEVVGKISKLKNELQTNKPIEALTASGSDVRIWNSYLEHQANTEGTEPRWFDSPWLYIECYMYRRVREAFELTKFLNSVDPFQHLKEATLLNSLGAIEVLSSHVREVLQNKKCHDIKGEFFKLLYVDLWGNRCDLSLSAGTDVVVKEDPLEKIIELREFVLTDKTDDIWAVLESHKGKSNVIIDIVMDNAGYELFTDLCLADFLLTYSFARQIRFRVKTLPWYVSDTRIPDIHWTLEKLSKSQNSHISSLASGWKQYISSGKWSLHADEFWTTPYSFSQMKSADPALYEDLAKSELVIFKGDLNYRKLLGDINWEPTKPFSEALCGFQPTNVAALRTLKADLICGLSPGQAEETASKSSDWLTSGKYAVIHFSKSP